MTASREPRAGDVLAGKYRVERVLGRGGMGSVALATELTIDEPVAVKFLHPWLAKDPELVLRFQREAKAARKIRSEHVVRILDVGTLENGAPYMVMEYLAGIDLDALLQRDGPQTVFAAVDTLLQAMEALAEAHVQGMVHRDLKPANLFLAKRASGEPLVKVLDFGISKVTGNAGAELALTKTNTKTLGSPLYMAPEQMRSLKNVDARTDIWALGVILYELLAGKPPFDGESLTELTAMILQDAPRPLQAHRRDVPLGLAHVVERCLQKDPAARFQDVASFAAALGPYASPAGRISVERIAGVLRQAGAPNTSIPPQASPPPVRISAPPRHNATTSAGATLPAPVASPPSRALGIAIGIAVALVVGGLAFVAILFFAIRAARPEAAPVAAVSLAPLPTPPPPVPAIAPAKHGNKPWAESVRIEPMTGVYGKPFDVVLTTRTENAAIRYTLDGRDPTEESPLYREPIHVTKTTTLNAVAFAPGHAPSFVAYSLYQVMPTALDTPISVHVEDTECGATPPPVSIPIANKGKEPLSITVAMTSGDASPFAVASSTPILAPGAAGMLYLGAKAVLRKKESLEGYADSIAIDEGGRRRNVSVSGRGKGAAFSVLDDGALEFDDVKGGKASDPVRIRVRNVGVLPVDVKADGPGGFRIDPVAMRILPQTEGVVSVVFSPPIDGSYGGALEIAPTSPGCSGVVSIPIKGRGTH